MVKEKFLELFSKDMQKDAQKLYNYFETAEKYDINIFTEEFYTPNFWKVLGDRISGVSVKTHGISEFSERRQILFIKDDSFDLQFPNIILEIKNLSKFKDQEHKDYLGSILGLNIKRELLGDIIVLEDRAYVIVTEKICEYLINNLKQIGRSPCEVNVIDDLNIIPEVEFQEEIIRVSSKRLDSVVSELMKVSRSLAVEGIEKGSVMLNYTVQKQKDKSINITDIITIRQYGKFIFSEDLGFSKKGKNRLLFKKYV